MYHGVFMFNSFIVSAYVRYKMSPKLSPCGKPTGGMICQCDVYWQLLVNLQTYLHYKHT